MDQLPMECVARTIWFLMLNGVARLSCVCRMFSAAARLSLSQRDLHMFYCLIKGYRE